MIISKMYWEDKIYYSLHAEQAMTSAVLDSENTALQDILTIETLKRISDNVKKEDNIILDFTHIEDAQQNIHKLLAEIKSSSKSLALLNINDCLHKKLELSIIENEKNICDAEGIYQVFYIKHVEDIDPDFYLKQHFNLTFKELLKKHIIKQQTPHVSSSVYLSAYIDLKKFISHDKAFMLFSIYQLAYKLKCKWLIHEQEEPILVCQNSNSAYIASILSSFLKLDLLILDKIGPINKIYTRLGNPIQSNKKYIVVSDLVCLGTEVKIAKNIIEFLGGSYLGNVAIIRAKTLAKRDKNFNNALAVFTITKSNKKDLGYYIYSELDKNNDE